MNKRIRRKRRQIYTPKVLTKKVKLKEIVKYKVEHVSSCDTEDTVSLSEPIGKNSVGLITAKNVGHKKDKAELSATAKPTEPPKWLATMLKAGNITGLGIFAACSIGILGVAASLVSGFSLGSPVTPDQLIALPTSVLAPFLPAAGVMFVGGLLQAVGGVLKNKAPAR